MTGANFRDNWLLPIREHITSVIVDRTQRAEKKLRKLESANSDIKYYSDSSSAQPSIQE